MKRLTFCTFFLCFHRRDRTSHFSGVLMMMLPLASSFRSVPVSPVSTTTFFPIWVMNFPCHSLYIWNVKGIGLKLLSASWYTSIEKKYMSSKWWQTSLNYRYSHFPCKALHKQNAFGNSTECVSEILMPLTATKSKMTLFRIKVTLEVKRPYVIWKSLGGGGGPKVLHIHKLFLWKHINNRARLEIFHQKRLLHTFPCFLFSYANSFNAYTMDELWYLLSKCLQWCHIYTSPLRILGEHPENGKLATNRLPAPRRRSNKHVVIRIIHALNTANKYIPI